MASAGRNALIECGEIIKRAHTYRARADGCGKGCDDGSAPRDDGYAVRDDGSAVLDDRSAACNNRSTLRNDGYESLKKNGRRRVRNVRRRLRSRDNGSRGGRRRVARRAMTGPTPRGRVAAHSI